MFLEEPVYRVILINIGVNIFRIGGFGECPPGAIDRSRLRANQRSQPQRLDCPDGCRKRADDTERRYLESSNGQGSKVGL